MKAGILVAMLAAMALFAFDASAQQETGTLNLEVKPFSSEVKLKKKVQTQLESGGIEWGIKDKRVVFTSVNKRFIDADLAHMTRYGENKQIQLTPGEYSITAIGLEMRTAFSPEKVLAKGAFVNENTVGFVIEAGKTTTISVDPVIRKDMTFLVDWYMPALMTSVVGEGGGSSEPVAINIRGANSIAWPDYNGDLKFVAK